MPSRYERKTARGEHETLDGKSSAVTPARPHKGRRGKLGGVAGTVSEVPKYNTKKPAVAEHLATAVVSSGMDYKEAAARVAPELTPRASALLAAKLERDPNVQEAVEWVLSARGLDDDSKKQFVEFTWECIADLQRIMRDKNTPPNVRANIGLKAMQIMGKGFIGERVIEEKPQSLLIMGHEDGIARLMGGVEADVEEIELPEIDSKEMN